MALPIRSCPERQGEAASRNTNDEDFFAVFAMPNGSFRFVTDRVEYEILKAKKDTPLPT